MTMMLGPLRTEDERRRAPDGQAERGQQGQAARSRSRRGDHRRRPEPEINAAADRAAADRPRPARQAAPTAGSPRPRRARARDEAKPRAAEAERRGQAAAPKAKPRRSRQAQAPRRRPRRRRRPRTSPPRPHSAPTRRPRATRARRRSCRPAGRALAPRPKRASARAARVLRPSGLLAIAAPAARARSSPVRCARAQTAMGRRRLLAGRDADRAAAHVATRPRVEPTLTRSDRQHRVASDAAWRRPSRCRRTCRDRSSRERFTSCGRRMRRRSRAWSRTSPAAGETVAANRRPGWAGHCYPAPSACRR